MTLDQLYAQYGKQMVDLEILNSQISQTKQAIVIEANKPKPELLTSSNE